MTPVANFDVAVVITLPMFERILAQIRRAFRRPSVCQQHNRRLSAMSNERACHSTSAHLVCLKSKALFATSCGGVRFEPEMLLTGFPTLDRWVLPISTKLLHRESHSYALAN
eukprot:SAG31_NODE_6351_length_2052_cov_1.141833_1_plen_112_part_00